MTILGSHRFKALQKSNKGDILIIDGCGFKMWTKVGVVYIAVYVKKCSVPLNILSNVAGCFYF